MEVADAYPAVYVRDTTDRDGAVLGVSAETWRMFTATIRSASTGS